MEERELVVGGVRGGGVNGDVLQPLHLLRPEGCRRRMRRGDERRW
jgi:hypothetical protein